MGETSLCQRSENETLCSESHLGSDSAGGIGFRQLGCEFRAFPFEAIPPRLVSGLKEFQWSCYFYFCIARACPKGK